MHAALEVIRRRGGIGERSLIAAIRHADGFAELVGEACHARTSPAGPRLADLGSGGGLPGLVVALRHRQLAVTLIERRQSRADLLSRAARSLGLVNVEVIADDVRSVIAAQPASFDLVTARAFAPLPWTVGCAAALLRTRGTVLVSEPPAGGATRLAAVDLGPLGLGDAGARRGVRVLRRRCST